MAFSSTSFQQFYEWARDNKICLEHTEGDTIYYNNYPWDTSSQNKYYGNSTWDTSSQNKYYGNSTWGHVFLRGNNSWEIINEDIITDNSITVVKNGTKLWYKNGKLHREDGPAVEYENGDTEWWLDGREYEPTEHVKKLYKAGNL